MADKVVIDIVANFTDNASGEADKLQKKVDKLDGKKAVVKFDGDISSFSKKYDDIQKKLDRFDSETITAKLDIKDSASQKISLITDKTVALANEVYEVEIVAVDSATKGVEGIGTTIKNMLDGVDTVVGGINNAKSIAGFLGSASKGTGILGFGSNAAIALGGGNLSSTASLSAGGLSALGLSAVAGGVIGAGTLVSAGGDIYNAFQTEGKESTYNAVKGGTKILGVGSGAAIGAGIGSVIPGVGTLIGGLIGAGVGGLAGIFGGDAIGKQLYNGESLEEYTARVEELEPAMEGYSEATKNMLRHSKMTASELEAIKKTNLEKWFGDVALSAKDISEIGSTISKNVLGTDNLFLMNEYESSTQRVTASLADMDKYLGQTNHKKYELRVGMSLSQEDSGSYVTAIDGYVSSVQDYLSEKRYQVSLAAEFILGENSSLGSEFDSGMAELEQQATELRRQIDEAIQNALNDDLTPYEIDFDEKKVIDNYVKKLESFNTGLKEAEAKVDLQLLKEKYGNPANISMESREKLFNEFDAQKELTIESANENRRTLLIQNEVLNKNNPEALALAEAEINSGYNSAVDKINSGYAAEKIPYLTGSSVNAKDSVLEANNELMNGFLANVPENLSAIENNFRNESWDVSGWYSALLDDFDSLDFANGFADHIATAEGALLEFKGLEEMYKEANLEIPNWITESIDLSEDIINFSNVDQLDPNTLWGAIADRFEGEGELDIADTIREKLEAGFFDALDVDNLEFNRFGELIPEAMAASIGSANTDAVVTSFVSLQSKIEEEAKMTLGQPISIDVPVNINLQGNYSSGSDDYEPHEKATGARYYATGGFVNSRILSWIGEEGPEAIIPLVSSRRQRGLDLWYKTGQKLGVLENANGGIYGSGAESGGFSLMSHEPISSSGGNSITFGEGAVTIKVDVKEGQTIKDALAENLEEIGEDVAGAIIRKLGPQFENMPVRA